MPARIKKKVFKPKVPPTLKADIFNCSRCRGTHMQMTFKRLKGDPIDGKDCNYTHWAMCPETDQPIVLGITKTT